MEPTTWPTVGRPPEPEHAIGNGFVVAGVAPNVGCLRGVDDVERLVGCFLGLGLDAHLRAAGQWKS
jgi:hypothetical protein